MSWWQSIRKTFARQDDFGRAITAYNTGREPAHQFAICHAPFKNLYFGHKGMVTACCYNRAFPIGFFPKQSIREIWEGERTNTLREHLKQNNLKRGCINCETQLLGRNIDAFKAKQFDNNPLNDNGYPSVFEFELDNTCNLDCVMCSEVFSSTIAQRKGLPKYQTPYGDDFVKQLEEFIPHLTETKFYGGEPFMIKTYYDIWDRIVALNPACRISIQTNGTMMNSRIKALLDAGNFHLNISIDSLQKENYESIRRGAHFEDVMRNIEVFYEHSRTKNTFFGISACMMRSNWHEAPEFVKWCNEREVPIYFHTVFYPKNCAIHSLKAAELEKVINKLGEFTFPAATPLQQKNQKHYIDLIHQVEFWLERKKVEKEIDENTEITFDHVSVALSHLYVTAFGAERGKKLFDQISPRLKAVFGELPPAELKYALRETLSAVHTGEIPFPYDASEEELRRMVQLIPGNIE